MCLSEGRTCSGYASLLAGAMEGVKSRSKVVLRMNNVTFQYPTKDLAAGKLLNRGAWRERDTVRSDIFTFRSVFFVQIPLPIRNYFG